MLRFLFRFFVPVNRWLYERTGGEIGGNFGGAPVLLLTTTGRRTGKRRTTPLLYLADGERLVVVASAGGAPSHPGWLFNLRSQPDVEVQIGRDERKMRARESVSDERSALWRRVVAMYPSYEAYQRRTEREIPVVVLSARPAS